MEKEEICKCGHTRGMHGGVKMFEDGQVPPPYEKDGACRADREGKCPCGKYEIDEKRNN